MLHTIRYRNLINEITFTTTRSSGPGGQNVNKVNSKVVLRFNISESNILSEGEKQLLLAKLKGKLTNSDEIILSSEASRSQLQNKKMVIEEFYKLFEKALTPVKKRFKTKRTRASVEKRLTSKKQHSQKKANRRLREF
ncbi:aminoacyl-tRNA hydrolase [Carboxylicivirga sp. A043]|uniref:alternative ribosome rescue aminoacyl-tRNA hydrolase ArfB n=1 Tax=Carboxylicivirga litoralis TaxID=2816963 RepID=UPI0021CB01BA|nr:alternative ribosome rescue aminoacyl-tRNA hydrolase ArfB [Carboxylicivirga sp. A043]MCU4156986.1 aminoacyl-tRNA hydrolase [Carboxylicivirga sp. A043]